MLKKLKLFRHSLNHSKECGIPTSSARSPSRPLPVSILYTRQYVAFTMGLNFTLGISTGTNSTFRDTKSSTTKVFAPSRIKGNVPILRSPKSPVPFACYFP